MTSNHLFFIPALFFIGFLLGMFTSDYGSDKKSNTTTRTSHIKSLGVTFGIFALVFVLTHLLPIPGGVKALHASLGHQPLFDQHISSSVAEVYSRLESFGEFGRAAYMRFTYTSDILFPLSFLLFLITLGKFTQKKITLRKPYLKILLYLPIVWFICDMVENATIYTLLASYPNQNTFVASLLGPITILKFSLLLLSIVAPTMALIVFRKTKPIDLR